MFRFWRLLGSELRFCAHTGGVQDKKAVAVLGSGGSGMDRAVFLDWISSAPIAYLTIFVKYLVLWIYEIYVDLLVRGINRVGRYIWSKYILTDVIE